MSNKKTYNMYMYYSEPVEYLWKRGYMWRCELQLLYMSSWLYRKLLRMYVELVQSCMDNFSRKIYSKHDIYSLFFFFYGSTIYVRYSFVIEAHHDYVMFFFHGSTLHLFFLGSTNYILLIILIYLEAWYTMYLRYFILFEITLHLCLLSY